MKENILDFTVLIPVYKNDKTGQLQDCLESIKAQTLPANEVIILVDGPVSEDLRKEIKNSHFSHIFFEENRGLPTVLNEGIKVARNEIIFRMDADDIAVADRFEKQIKFLKMNPQIALIGGQVQEFINSPKDTQNFRRVPLNHKDIIRFSKWRNPFNHPTIAFKKSIIEKLQGYNTEAKYFEDYELWIRTIAAGYKTANLPDILCYMRTSDDFIKRRAGVRYLKHEMYLLRSMLKSNYINFLEFIVLTSIRLPIRVLPLPVLKLIYNKFLRQK